MKWKPVIERAAVIAGSYDTLVTLRQLFYRLVAAHLIANNLSQYKLLSRYTAEARREGWFPALLDQGRVINTPTAFEGIADALLTLSDWYRLDRTSGQDHQVWVVVEKATLVEQVRVWVDDYGLPVAACRGYSSQTLCDNVTTAVYGDGRKAVLLYVGDLDPSGEDIDRDFLARTDCWDRVERLAVLPEHVAAYDLAPTMGKETDSRAGTFVARHGDLFQVEVEAIDPAVLRGLVLGAVNQYVDLSINARVRQTEEQDRARIGSLARAWDDQYGDDGELDNPGGTP